MIIDIGTGVDESVVMWKYNDKDKWRDADIDELIHLYESIVRCKDCKHYIVEGITTQYGWCHKYKHSVNEDDFCSYGEVLMTLPSANYITESPNDVVESQDDVITEDYMW